MKIRLDDYIDADVAYLMGLIIARGTISEVQGMRQIIIQFPYSSLRAQGISSSFEQDISIRLGIENIRERLLTLLSEDITTVKNEREINLVVRFMRNSMAWRNILLLTRGATSFPYFQIPPIFFRFRIASRLEARVYSWLCRRCREYSTCQSLRK